MRKIFFKLCLIAGTVGLVSCSGNRVWGGDSESAELPADEEEYLILETARVQSVAENCQGLLCPNEEAAAYNKRIPPLNTLIVCRDKQCAPAELSMSREYIFNSLAQLIDNNLDKTALLCEANPQAHVCTNPYITVPAKVGVTPAYVFFDGVKIVDAANVKGKTALNLALGYNLSYNGQTPMVCKPDKSMIYVKSNHDVLLGGNGFKCEMTSVGATTIRIMFNIDYIDMDYGYLGGYYTIGLSGPANGGGSGYGLIRLPEEVKILDPELSNPAAAKKPIEPSVHPDINDEALINVTTYGVMSNKPQSSPRVETPISAPASMPAVNEPESEGFEFEHESSRTDLTPSRPIKLKPHMVVRSDGSIVPSDLAPSQKRMTTIEVTGSEAPYEEIYVDDLDEYIK